MKKTGFLTIGEAAKAAGVTRDAVRHYVRIGLIDPERGENGYRRLSDREVRRIRFIRRSQRLGFTLEEIRAIVQESSQGKTPCPLVRDILRQRVLDNKRVLDEVVMLQQRMEGAIKQWDSMPDGVPDGEVVCALIESLDEN